MCSRPLVKVGILISSVELLIFLHNLAVLNTGTDPTFINHLMTIGICPDITLCSPQLEDYITNWQVTDAVSGSDHNLILFDVQLDHGRVERRTTLGWWSSAEHS